MRILWIVNIELAVLRRALGHKAVSGGGWMEGALSNLRKLSSDSHLGIASMYSGTKLEHYSLDGMEFYRIPYHSRKHCDVQSIQFFNELYRDFKPDLIHIHGTEYPHALTAAQCAGKIPVVISIQGIINACQFYALGGLSRKILLAHTTLRDLVRFNLPTAILKDMKRRGKLEKETLQQVSHVIGRTDWDHAQALHLNPHLSYHFGNETLRENFYEAEKWTIEKCRKHMIFASNSSVPLKGMHQLIQALALVREKYPDVHLMIAGEDILHNQSWKNRLKRTGYSHYLRKLILRLDLQDHISFTGMLSAEQMKEAFLRCNVYVLPSAIENSPNTLGEAQILGVPVIAAEVGGVLSMIKHKESGFVYRYEDSVQLAYWIGQIFDNPQQSVQLGKSGRQSAEFRHNRERNAQALLEIYHAIVTDKNAENREKK